jgi:hypothetical protein
MEVEEKSYADLVDGSVFCVGIFVILLHRLLDVSMVRS